MSYRYVRAMLKVYVSFLQGLTPKSYAREQMLVYYRMASVDVKVMPDALRAIRLKYKTLRIRMMAR